MQRARPLSFTVPLAEPPPSPSPSPSLRAVRGDLIRIMHKLLKRRGKLDAIIVETTGLANPGPVIQTFFMDEEIKVGACPILSRWSPP